MGFGFTHHSDVQAQVRAIAVEQIAEALAACREDEDLDKVVHGLRRRCKRLRGLLRLIEPHFKPAKSEDRCFRDAARGLSGTRDAAVMVETFAGLLAAEGQRDGGGGIDPGRGAALAQWLGGRIGQKPTEGDRAALLAPFVALFEAAEKRARRWSLSGSGFDRIGDGLEDTYRAMRDDLQRAEAKPSALLLHDWRKHTKYHWHHVSLLQAAAPDLLRPRKESLDRLGEMLGDHHNLAVLDALLAGQDDITAVRQAIAARQDVLTADALTLGRQLAAEKPRALRERFEHYWHLLPGKA
jgi:hypothetical protein